MGSVRSLTSNINDAVSILGGDDDYRRELLLYVLLHADPRDPVGEAIHADLIGKLYAMTTHGQQSIEAYKSGYSNAIFDHPDEASHQSPSQSSAKTG